MLRAIHQIKNSGTFTESLIADFIQSFALLPNVDFWKDFEIDFPNISLFPKIQILSRSAIRTLNFC